MRDPDIREEIQSAVRDYVDQLLATRSRAGSRTSGQPMSTALPEVTPEELMVAARAAGQRGSRQEVVALTTRGPAISHLSYSVDPPVPDPSESEELLALTPDGLSDTPVPGRPASVCSQPARHSAIRSKSVPAQKTKHRRDYHWSVWKTTPTPAPGQPDVPAVTTPLPRPPSATRPATLTAVLKTPDPAPARDPFSTPSGVPNVPVPGDPRGIRVPTPVNRNPTPMELKADSRDVLSEPQIVPADRVLKQLCEDDDSPAYIPALKAWASNANDYERDVAFSLMKSMGGGRAVTPVRDIFRTGGPKPQHRTTLRAKTAGIRTKPMHLTAPHLEQHYLNVMGRALERQAPVSIYDSYPAAQRPIGQHPGRPTNAKDYTHEASMFQNAGLPYKSHFTIHPEWISEVDGLKRNLVQMKTTKGPKGFRYSSK